MSTDQLQQLSHQFDQLISWPSTDRQQIELPVAGGTLKAVVSAADGIGCAVECLQLCVVHAQRDIKAIRALGQKLAEQIRYLVEPLALIEVDAQQAQAQVRSDPPTQQQGQAAYYELLVSPHGLRLERYTAARGADREKTPMHLTRELLRRLAADFIGAAQS